MSGTQKENQDLMDSYHNHQQQHRHHDSGLTRNRSDPSSSFESLINGSNSYGDSANGGLDCNDDYRFILSPSPEMGNPFAKFISQCAEEKVMKREEKGSISQQNGYFSGSGMVYGNLGVQNLANGSSAMEGSFGVMNNTGLENTMQAETGNSNGSNLGRHNSSPAGFLSNSVMQNGFTEMKDLRGFGNSKTTDGDASSSTSGLNGPLNLSYAPSSSNSRIMAHIPETEHEAVLNVSNDPWNKTWFNVLKGTGGNTISFSLDTHHNGNSWNRLSHHWSLPTTFFERATVEKFLHFQGTVPCKIRAKRGCATKPRSITERVRRTRISERMRKLQDLVDPNMDKTNTADMIDMAVAHIKELEKQVEALMDTRAKCRCAGKEKQYG